MASTMNSLSHYPLNVIITVSHYMAKTTIALSRLEYIYVASSGSLKVPLPLLILGMKEIFGRLSSDPGLMMVHVQVMCIWVILHCSYCSYSTSYSVLGKQHE